MLHHTLTQRRSSWSLHAYTMIIARLIDSVVCCHAVLCCAVSGSKLDAPWADIIFTHLRAAQQRAEGNAAEGFQLYTAQGLHMCPAPAQQVAVHARHAAAAATRSLFSMLGMQEGHHQVCTADAVTAGAGSVSCNAVQHRPGGCAKTLHWPVVILSCACRWQPDQGSG
jgi:hypothetical protein